MAKMPDEPVRPEDSSSTGKNLTEQNGADDRAADSANQRVAAVRAAAEQDDADAQMDLGCMYLTGQGVLQDDAQAVEWLLRAAEQGHGTAQAYLGVLYANGRGVLRDDAQAAQWFQRFTEGNADLQFELGDRYANGRDLPQDDTQAAQWFRRAAELGHVEAQFNLGLLYAEQWLLRAAEQGHAEAQFKPRASVCRAVVAPGRRAGPRRGAVQPRASIRPGRTPARQRERYQRSLTPNTAHRAWSPSSCPHLNSQTTRAPLSRTRPCCAPSAVLSPSPCPQPPRTGGSYAPPRGVIPRDPTREPNGTFGSGPSSPTGGQVWVSDRRGGHRPDAVGARGPRLVDAFIVWILTYPRLNLPAPSPCWSRWLVPPPGRPISWSPAGPHARTSAGSSSSGISSTAATASRSGGVATPRWTRSRDHRAGGQHERPELGFVELVRVEHPGHLFLSVSIEPGRKGSALVARTDARARVLAGFHRGVVCRAEQLSLA